MTTRGVGTALWGAVCVAAVIFGGMSCSRKGGAGGTAAHDGPDVILGSMQAGKHRVGFYIDYGRDIAVLGFTLKGRAGRPRYFPMYGSTYRELPPVTLDVFLSDTAEEMWVLSSWKGHEVLAHYRVGNDRCMTCYGETAASSTPTPQSIGGGKGQFPPMNPAHARKELALVHK